MSRDTTKVLSDEALRKAAKAMVGSMLASIPEPSEIDHTFSEAFEAKMNTLVHTADKRVRFVAIRRQIAAVLAAAFLASSTFMAVNPDARAAFSNWICRVYEDSVIYKFIRGSKTAQAVLPEYELTWLPEGMELVAKGSTSSTNYAYFQNPETGDELFFQYGFVSNLDYLSVPYLDTEEKGEYIELDNYTACFYSKITENPANTLVWIDGEYGIAFGLNSRMEKSLIIGVANQVKMVDITK